MIISLLILLLLPLILGNIILTVFNGIFGPDNGLWITNLFMRICFPIISAAIIFFIKFKNSEEKRNYLKSMEGMEYDTRKDVSIILKSKDFRIECTVFSALFIFYALIGDPSLIMYIILSALFILVNLYLTQRYHKSCCDQRMRK